MGTARSALRSLLGGSTAADLASFEEVRGFVFAVAGAPELVPPSEWLPEAFGGELPEFRDEQQARSVVAELMDLYNSTVEGGSRMLRQAPRFRSKTVSNLEMDSAVSRWSQGFIRGHSWLSDIWNEYLPDEFEEEFGSLLLALSFFSSRQMAEAFNEEAGSGKPVDVAADIIRRTFRDAMVEYQALGRSIYEARLKFEQAAPEQGAKISRNAPCPCGSGRKYKRCCGAPAS
jgi:uncharacterized protein